VSRISVPNQALIDVSTAQNPALGYGANGILGLGFTALSTIDALVNKTDESTGRSLLFNLFQDNPSQPNFIAFALQRDSDPTDDIQGSISVGMLGEIVE
jgi:saccharopepsin